MARFLVQIRISEYDRNAAAWKTAHVVDQAALDELKCSFVAPRVEDRLSLTLFERGTIAMNPGGSGEVGGGDGNSLFDGSPPQDDSFFVKIQRDASNLLNRIGALYRIDVYCPETSEVYEGRSVDATWGDQMLFWSGVIERVQAPQDQNRRGVKLTARGWTSFLDRIVLRDRYYYKQTIAEIVDDIFNLATNGIAAVWPGSIYRVPSIGSDANVEIERIGWKAATARQILDELAALGNYYFGVAVHGHPFTDITASTAPFKLLFIEPTFELDIDRTSSPGREEVNQYVDVASNPNVVSYEEQRDDSRYATRWECLGETPFVDFRSVISGHDADEIRDIHAKTSGQESGALKWEPGGFVGWELVLLDRARRQYLRDSETGEVFPAGRIEEVDEFLRGVDVQTSFPIDSYTEDADEAIFGVNNFPAPANDLTLDLENGGLRYTIRPVSARVVRVIMDEELDDATNADVPRERIARFVDDANIRGYLHAGLYAIQDRWNERFSSLSAVLKMRKWTRTITGGDYIRAGLIVVGDKNQRMTVIGTTANGGDNYAKGDDTNRRVGLGRALEMRRAEAKLTDDGWDVTWQLAGTAIDLSTVLLPDSVRSRNRRRN